MAEEGNVSEGVAEIKSVPHLDVPRNDTSFSSSSSSSTTSSSFPRRALDSEISSSTPLSLSRSPCGAVLPLPLSPYLFQ